MVLIYKNNLYAGQYEGKWRYNKPNGTGKLKYNDGSIYEGKFEMGIKKGQGKMTYANGDVYEGQWLNDKRHGNGEMTSSDEELRYRYSPVEI